MVAQPLNVVQALTDRIHVMRKPASEQHLSAAIQHLAIMKRNPFQQTTVAVVAVAAVIQADASPVLFVLRLLTRALISMSIGFVDMQFTVRAGYTY